MKEKMFLYFEQTATQVKVTKLYDREGYGRAAAQKAFKQGSRLASELVFPELRREKHPPSNNTTQAKEQLVYCRNPTSESGACNILPNTE